MKKLLIGLIVFLIGATGVSWSLHRKGQRQKWSAVQIVKGVKLSSFLREYYETHQFYPESLNGLVEAGMMSEKELEKAKFQWKVGAKKEEWEYFMPQKLADAFLLSPKPISPWNGHSGEYILVRVDGSAQVFAAGKLENIKKKIKQ